MKNVRPSLALKRQNLRGNNVRKMQFVV